MEGSQSSQCSQDQLDSYDKAEISVRSKAPELIGRMTVSLWIYCKGTLYFIISLIHNYDINYCLRFW